ncbi:MAG: hypothetical protein IPK82_42110 [Polyangiaceae bacterium]|nr:hypothetical protein [Polyangiaceae bacterium]
MRIARLKHHFVPALLPIFGAVYATALVGCDDGAPCEPGTSSALTIDRLTQRSIDKVDIVLAIDNSRSMADKQQILSLAIPRLIGAIANPPCIVESTGEEIQALSPLDKCPDGTKRKSEPILDIHVGVISSSLGGHGSDACSSVGAGKQSNNDKGHLLARVDPTNPVEVETYQNLKFLAWDPAQKLTPPGEADADIDSAADANSTALYPTLADMVIGVGQVGCGYESQLESWYRFLVDPAPPAEVKLDAGGNVLLEGVDNQLLQERKNFLRPGSLLAIFMLSDENDCSIREQGKFYYAAQQKAGDGSPFHLPKARAICDQDPNNECCFSCGQKGPIDDSGNDICADDPTCKDANGGIIYYTDADLGDNINLRCFNQKRRFGIDFLYPLDRYVSGLTDSSVTDRNGSVVPNPLYTDLDPADTDSTVRTSDMVFLAAVVGVPWQDVARINSNGQPDLKAGVDFAGQPKGGFKTGDELAAEIPGKGYSGWDVILGKPENYPAAASLPKDPLMIESVEPRSGTHPITGDPLVGSSTPLANKINGHEYSIPKRDDLQFACIFPLAQPVNCADGTSASCDCDSVNDSPLCQVDPNTGDPTVQVYAKAYPGIRELQVVKALGNRGIAGSICPAQMTLPNEKDFGYTPSVAALGDRLVPAISGQCAKKSVTVNSEGQVACLMIEATTSNTCDCGVPGRDPVSSDHAGAVDAIKELNPNSAFSCFCEIPQLSGKEQGDPLWACQNDASPVPTDSTGQPLDGYCYIEPSQGAGSDQLVENCPSDERRIFRFVGNGQANPGATLFLVCNDESAINNCK